MKKKILFLTMIILCTALSSVVAFAAPPSDAYVLVFSDEFNEDTLDTAVWDYRLGGRYGSVNKPENVRIANGSLLIDYKKVGDEFSGGGVCTTFPMGYGYYEVRTRVFDGANGLHTSFWLTGASCRPTKPENEPTNISSMEIDIFEIDSRQDGKHPNISHGTHLFYKETDSSFRERYEELDVTEWFVMGLERLPDRLNFYINGELISTHEDISMFGPTYMWLTALASPEHYLNEDGTYNIDFSKLDENGLFGSSEFDYFRYYQQPMQNNNLFANHNFEVNRSGAAAIPRLYTVKGDSLASSVEKSPFAYEGFLTHSHKSGVPYELMTGQELWYILPGNYTFKGQFKASDGFTTARLAVYEKDGTLIASKDIPVCDNWTEVTLTDIPINDYAFAVVESASEGGTVLAMDCLEFYKQEGTHYPYTSTPAYERYMGGNILDTTVYTFEEASDSVGLYHKSSVKGYYLNENNPDAYVEWTIKADKDGSYTPQWYHLPRSDSPVMQYMKVILPDGTEHVTALDGKVGVEGYVSLGDFELKLNEELKVRTYYANKSNKNLRITELRVPYTEELFYSQSTLLQLGERIFVHQEYPYLFDKADETLVPYKKDGVYYIPYQTLHAVAGITADIGEDSVYVTDEQLKNAGLAVTVSDHYLFLHQEGLTFTATADEACRDALMEYTSPDTILKSTYVSNDNDPNQLLFKHTEAFMYGNWNNSSHIISHKYTDMGETNAYAEWNISAPSAGGYALEYYSPNHINASSGTEISVYFNGTKQRYMLNQTDESKIGWYNLGNLTLTDNLNIKVHVERKASQGHMRVYAIRLVPLTREATYAGNMDDMMQEYYPHTAENVVKTGSYITSGAPHGDCIAWRNSEREAKITWTLSPLTENNYSVQVFNPRFAESSTTKALVKLGMGAREYHYELNQKPESAEETLEGWYDLGTFTLTPEDVITISMEHAQFDSWLRAKAVRLVPQNVDMHLTGNFDEPTQELHEFAEATTVGSWGKSSGTGTIKGAYYTQQADASVTWNFKPQKAQKYSVQVFMPCSAGNSATAVTVALTIDNGAHTFTFNQSQDTATYAGWYELCLADLTEKSDISITIQKISGSNLRAKAVRLIPYPGAASVVKDGTTVTANIGTLSRYHDSFLVAEFDANGILQSVKQFDTAPAVNLTLADAENSVNLFFWNDNFYPVTLKAE